MGRRTRRRARPRLGRRVCARRRHRRRSADGARRRRLHADLFALLDLLLAATDGAVADLVGAREAADAHDHGDGIVAQRRLEGEALGVERDVEQVRRRQRPQAGAAANAGGLALTGDQWSVPGRAGDAVGAVPVERHVDAGGGVDARRQAVGSDGVDDVVRRRICRRAPADADAAVVTWVARWCRAQASTADDERARQGGARGAVGCRRRHRADGDGTVAGDRRRGAGGIRGPGIGAVQGIDAPPALGAIWALQKSTAPLGMGSTLSSAGPAPACRCSQDRCSPRAGRRRRCRPCRSPR